MAAVDYFLVIDGIKGETKDSKMASKGAIDVDSWSWGETQSGSHSSGGGGGAGKVVMQDMHFVAKMSAASPLMALACADGRHIKEATLTCRKAGKQQQEFFVIKLNDILVSSYQTGGNGSSEIIPMDQFALNFSKIEWAYAAQKPDGTLESPKKYGYDVKANKQT